MTTSIDMDLSVRIKKAHESRFYLILNALSDEEIPWIFFRETLKFLCIPELNEIVEERISKNKCGYVLCDKLINIHPTATVSLNISKRKIFDITNRKKFCSDWCYGAHKYISTQMPDDPAWKNIKHEFKDFKLYPKNESGCPGEIYFEENEDEPEKKPPSKVMVNETMLKKTINSANPNPRNSNRVDKVQHVITQLDKLIVNKTKNLHEVVSRIKDKSLKNEGKKTIYIDDVLSEEQSATLKSELEVLKHAGKVASMICEWVTERARDFICRVRKYEYSDSENEDDDDKQEEDVMYEEDTPVIPCMPRLDSADQKRIRKSILIKRVKSAGTAILADFGVNKNVFIEQLDLFLDTCKLTSSNVFFSAKEFPWLVIFLVELLSPKLNNQIDTDKISIIKKYGISQTFLYDNLFAAINKTVYGESNITVSFQGDMEEMS